MKATKNLEMMRECRKAIKKMGIAIIFNQKEIERHQSVIKNFEEDMRLFERIYETYKSESGGELSMTSECDRKENGLNGILEKPKPDSGKREAG